MKKLIFLTLFLLLLVGAAFYINKQGTYQLFPSSNIHLLGVTTTPTPFPTTSPTQKVTPINQVIKLTIKDKKITNSSSDIQAKQNSVLVLQITSDAAGTFAIEGYNIQVSLLKDKEVTLSFPANIVGDFSLRLISANTTISTLHVTSQ